MNRLLILGMMFLILGCQQSSSVEETSVHANEKANTKAASSKVTNKDWATWRGPNLNGVAEAGQKVPTEWSSTNNVLWKTSVPGRGHASPTVIGNQVVLATADDQRQVQSVISFDRTTGKQLWQTTINEGGFPEKNHPKNTHASCTVVTDGTRLFVSVYQRKAIQVSALDMQGKILWQESVGPYHPLKYQYGYAASPFLYKSNVLIVADYEEGGFLASLNQQTGKLNWKKDRYKKLSFSSPVVANIAGKDQLLLSGCELVASYDPNNGEMLWSTPATTMATCGTMVWEGDLVFASGGYPKPETVCIKADGSGKIVWKNNQKCYEQSMVVHDGYLYAVNDNGIAYCWRAADGKEMWRERLAGPISSSPVLVNDLIYQSNERGTTYVFKATPEGYQQVASNQLETEAFASPTICNNRIYLRVANRNGGKWQETLYCIGEE